MGFDTLICHLTMSETGPGPRVSGQGNVRDRKGKEAVVRGIVIPFPGDQVG
jgi:hypothetical protein